MLVGPMDNCTACPCAKTSLTPVSSTNETDCHDITEILLKVALKHHNSSSKQYDHTIYMN